MHLARTNSSSEMLKCYLIANATSYQRKAIIPSAEHRKRREQKKKNKKRTFKRKQIETIRLDKAENVRTLEQRIALYGNKTPKKANRIETKFRSILQ